MKHITCYVSTKPYNSVHAGFKLQKSCLQLRQHIIGKYVHCRPIGFVTAVYIESSRDTMAELIRWFTEFYFYSGSIMKQIFICNDQQIRIKNL